MFTEQTLLLIFQYIAFIFILPPIVVLIVDRIVNYLARDAFSVYSATGIVGTPLHELSHAAACLLFGMRIIEIKLYSPDRQTGNLGYVNFAYNPRSTWHAVGLVIQGIAPLLMGFVIMAFLMPWGNAPDSVLRALDLTDASPTYKHALAGVSALLYGNLVDGARGFLWCLVALIIGLHAIPSWADIRIAGKGMLTLLALAIGLSALSQIDLWFLPPGIEDAIYAILSLALRGFFWLLEQMAYAVTMVTAVAVMGIVVFLLVPAMIMKLFRLATGRPAAQPFTAHQQAYAGGGAGAGAGAAPGNLDAGAAQMLAAVLIAQQANQQANQQQGMQNQAVPTRRETNITGRPGQPNRPS